MPQAKRGDTVRVHYSGKLEDGTVFDSSTSREPLEFTIGSGEVIPGVEQAVAGMEPGQTKSAEVPPEQGYGPHRDEMVAVIDRLRLPEDLDPAVGQRLSVQREDGGHLQVRVTDVSDRTITIDGNHELAGRNLHFDLQLVEVV